MRRALLHALALAAPAAAQQSLPARAMPGGLRDAGTYHVICGTWSHAGGSAQLGPDVIYDSTAPSGYYGTGWEGSEGVDEGILPTPGNPVGGPQDAYVIDGFEFAYCSMAGSVDWTFRFYDSYIPCDILTCGNLASDPIDVLAGPTGGACWTVTVDLTGGAEVRMWGDGGPCAPGYQGAATGEDHFGWGTVWSTDNGALTGPVIAGGDPSWAPEGEGTCYLPTLTCPAGASGLGQMDLFHINSPFSGCFWFGGYKNTNGCGGPSQGPPAQFHLRLFTDCSASGCSAVFCEAGPDQLGTLSISTCLLSGAPRLVSEGLTGGLFAYHLVGNGGGVISDPPGAKGDMCLGGSTPGIGRYVKDVGPVVGGVFSTDLIHGATGGGAGRFPDPPGGMLLSGWTWGFQTWVRLPADSRFTPAIRVLFL